MPNPFGEMEKSGGPLVDIDYDEPHRCSFIGRMPRHIGIHHHAQSAENDAAHDQPTHPLNITK